LFDGEKRARLEAALAGEGRFLDRALSPLLANIYLYALEAELPRRGLAFCRHASAPDPIVSVSRSPADD